MRFCRLFPLPAATFASPIRPRTSAEAGALSRGRNLFGYSPYTL